MTNLTKGKPGSARSLKAFENLGVGKPGSALAVPILPVVQFPLV